ncbi:MAG: hypothetical protein M0Q94_04405 [Candidatus Cloacimonetes bacterium]|nr:hypothetical protein [Candidatus Cloacimonadota bacterium]
MQINDKNRFFIPYIIHTDAELKTLQKKSSDVKLCMIGNNFHRVIWIENQDPVVYEEMIRFQWKELKQESRSSRCQFPDESGRLKRCKGNCSHCEETRLGGFDSIELMEESCGAEPVDPLDVIETATLWMTFQDMMAKARKIDPKMADILEALASDITERDLAASLGISKSTMHDLVVKARNFAAQILDGKIKG